jgi:hypothetical protein
MASENKSEVIYTRKEIEELLNQFYENDEMSFIDRLRDPEKVKIYTKIAALRLATTRECELCNKIHHIEINTVGAYILIFSDKSDHVDVCRDCYEKF